jgi:uncharacterized membrane protein YhaH (DUF805 family)
MMIFNAIRDAVLNTFTFSGRAERLEHWSFAVFTGICAFFIALFDKMVMPVSSYPINWAVLLLSGWLFTANLSLMVRRLHDHNFSGFLLFLPLICATAWLIGYEQSSKISGAWLERDTAAYMVIAGRWSFFGSFSVLLSFFSRAGEKKENKYGFPA